MDIAPGASISLSAKLDKTNPRGVHIGEGTSVTFGSAVLTHDYVNGKHLHTWIGKRCFIGARSIIMPGIRIGDECVIAPASVVMKDIPSNCLAAGNPARVIENSIRTANGGYRIDLKK